LRNPKILALKNIIFCSPKYAENSCQNPVVAFWQKEEIIRI